MEEKVNQYYENIQSPNAVHPGKAGLNLIVGLYGARVNPFFGVLYTTIDVFHPQGWPGFFRDQDALYQANKKINPNYQAWPGALKY